MDRNNVIVNGGFKNLSGHSKVVLMTFNNVFYVPNTTIFLCCIFHTVSMEAELNTGQMYNGMPAVKFTLQDMHGI